MSEINPTKHTELKAYVIAVGIKKRCRKAERHMLKLGNYPLHTPDAHFMALAATAVAEQMKTTQKTFLYIKNVEIENCGTYQVETVILTGDASEKRIEMVGA